MTGRVVDSYTNIATVKLFSHAEREEAHAREGLDGFLQTVHRQMRLVAVQDMTVNLLNAVLTGAVTGLDCGCGCRGGSTLARSRWPSRWRCGWGTCRTGSCGSSRRCSRISAPRATGLRRCRGRAGCRIHPP